MQQDTQKTDSVTQALRAEQRALLRLLRCLTADAASGNLDKSAIHLQAAPDARAAKALRYLGAGYAKSVMKGSNARYKGLRGKTAATAFTRDILLPRLAAAAAPKTPAPKKTGRLRRILRAGVSKMALCAALAAGGLFPQLVNHNEPSPVQAAMAQHNYFGTDLRTMPLRASFALTALGREMLYFADTNDISIRYDTTGSLKNKGWYGSYNNKQVLLNPDMDIEDSAVTLAHELRHAFQDIVLGYSQMEERLLTPVQGFTLRRTIEADAFAFGGYYLADRIIALGTTPEVTPANKDEMEMARQLLAYFNFEDVGAQEYLDSALAAGFRRVSASGYANHVGIACNGVHDVDHALTFAQIALGLGASEASKQRLMNAAARVASTPTDDEFLTYIRRFGAPSFNTAAETAMSRMSASDLFNVHAKPAGLIVNARPPMLPAIPDTPGDRIVRAMQKQETFNDRIATLKPTLALIEVLEGKFLPADIRAPAAAQFSYVQIPMKP